MTVDDDGPIKRSRPEESVKTSSRNIAVVCASFLVVKYWRFSSNVGPIGGIEFCSKRRFEWADGKVGNDIQFQLLPDTYVYQSKMTI